MTDQTDQLSQPAPKSDDSPGGFKIAAVDTQMRRRPEQGPTEAELAAERDLADEPKTPIGRGAYQFIPVRYDE